jgi:steroid 5-alpha reductase family enzyme
MTPEQTTAFMASAQAIAVMMGFIWLLSLILRDVSIVDLVWGLGFVLVAWAVFIAVPGESAGRWLLAGLTTLWGGRLSVYLAWRNHGRPEDFRYQQMRARRPWFPVTSLYVVFGLQGLVMWVVALPVQVGMSTVSAGWNWLHLVGVLLWVAGLFFESVGDWQLAKFRANPDNVGQVLDTGLWGLTRHPNYFGDFLVWWGLYFVAVAQSNAWWTAIGPIVMSFFLMRVSGVTLLEKTLQVTRPGYKDYVARTNAFFPALRKRS